MRPSEALRNNIDEVRRIIENSCAYNPRIFGSVARGEDTENSDLDLLVDVKPQTTLIDIESLRLKLEKVLIKRVEILTSLDLPKILKNEIITNAQPL